MQGSLRWRPPLLDFTEEHKLAAQLIRTWCATRLGPATADLEDSKTPPYALMRELCATFGIADMVRAALLKGRTEGEPRRDRDSSDPGREARPATRGERARAPRAAARGPSWRS